MIVCRYYINSLLIICCIDNYSTNCGILCCLIIFVLSRHENQSAECVMCWAGKRFKRQILTQPTKFRLNWATWASLQGICVTFFPFYMDSNSAQYFGGFCGSTTCLPLHFNFTTMIFLTFYCARSIACTCPLSKVK